MCKEHCEDFRELNRHIESEWRARWDLNHSEHFLNYDKPFIDAITNGIDAKLTLLRERIRFDRTISTTELVLLLLLAVVAPVVIGFQYIEWHDSHHLFSGIMAPIWTISYSDFYPDDWLILLIPNILILIPRLLFVFALTRLNSERPSLIPLGIFGGLLTAIDLYICLTMMIVNSIFGIPPGVLMLFPAPDVDVRLFVPVPILLLVVMHLIWKKQSSKLQIEEDGGPGGICSLQRHAL